MTHAPEPYYTPGWTAQNRHMTSVTSAPRTHYGFAPPDEVNVVIPEPEPPAKPVRAKSAKRR